MTSGSAAAPVETEDEIDSTESEYVWRTVLFNCECHSFDEVERQLMKAVRCTLSRARQWSWEVHSRGCAIVYTGPQERCEAVAGVLEDIGLVVKVSQ